MFKNNKKLLTDLFFLVDKNASNCYTKWCLTLFRTFLRNNSEKQQYCVRDVYKKKTTITNNAIINIDGGCVNNSITVLTCSNKLLTLDPSRSTFIRISS